MSAAPLRRTAGPGRIRTVLTIAGSDSSAGAGMQADLKTFQRCGVYGVCALTAVTAQTPSRVRGVYPLPAEAVVRQILAAARSARPDAAKTGMLWSEETVEAVSECLGRLGIRRIVVDPVLASHRGNPLIRSDGRGALVRRLFPMAAIVTPNLPEAARLAGMRIRGPRDVAEAARRLLATGPGAVLIKGGHFGGKATDWFSDGGAVVPVAAGRVAGVRLHGAGCILSAAIAAAMAKGASPLAAVRAGKAYVGRQIRAAWRRGGGDSVALHR
ncbi:MAG: bifunctional hydroxymethylpyrimidine kinase/phosphomethylpyrimidine kinase [bacterium]|nr:bifunctional hydroxymethylpyrimidine kinase/phosphomethylpyrimidine kinase [bacterium]